jgi:hypothetical protein
MNATQWGLALTLLTGFAAGGAATAWDERHMLVAVVATLIFQTLAIVAFLRGARRRRPKRHLGHANAHENRLTATASLDTMIALHTDNNQTGNET